MLARIRDDILSRLSDSPRGDKIAVLAFGCELRLNSQGEWEGFRLLLPLSSPTHEGVAALQAACIPRGPDHHVDLPQALYLCQKIFKEQEGEPKKIVMASLCLPFAASWLNCVPIPALGLHMRSNEFVAAIKFRLGMPVYSQERECTFCGANNDIMGDRAMVCRIGGEPLSRHNALRDALFNVPAEAGLSPVFIVMQLACHFQHIVKISISHFF